MSKVTIFYSLLASLIVGWYTISTATGTEYFHPGKEKTTAADRKTGYRGTHFIFIYHSRGGK